MFFITCLPRRLGLHSPPEADEGGSFSVGGSLGRKRVACLALFASLFLIVALPALAIEYGGFGCRPAYPRADNPRTESIFIHIMEPEDVQQEGVLVVNNTAEQKTILVYSVDSTPSTGGAFACEQLAETKKDVGAWIAINKSEVTLDPGTKEIVPFTITVPKNASVGEHNGCIITQEKLKKVEGKSGVQLSFRTGLRVAITIPGELMRELQIAGFSVTPKKDGNLILQPKVKNLGNVSIDADAKVATEYFFGAALSANGGNYPILRGDTSDWNFELKKPFWGGWYKSSFTVSYDKNPEASVGVQSGKELTTLQGPTVWFFSFPTAGGLAIEIVCFLLIATCLLLLWLAKKQKNWIKHSWVEYEISMGEDIKTLAERSNVSWKIVAKANKLQPPYALKPGEKIKIPPLE